MSGGASSSVAGWRGVKKNGTGGCSSTGCHSGCRSNSGCSFAVGVVDGGELGFLVGWVGGVDGCGFLVHAVIVKGRRGGSSGGSPELGQSMLVGGRAGFGVSTFDFGKRRVITESGKDGRGIGSGLVVFVVVVFWGFHG